MQLYFTFQNMFNLARAGYNPTQIFEELSKRVNDANFSKALLDMASATSTGSSISDRMQRFPDIFSPGSVGAIRAGENGGYLPEACERISIQFQDDHRMAWAVRIFRWALTSAVFGALFAIAMSIALGKLMDYYGSTTETAPSVGDRLALLGHFVREAFLGWPGWVLFGFTALIILVRLWFKRTEMMPWRHSMSFKIPLIARYAQDENLSSFTWHLQRLQIAGLSPMNSWILASQATPNVEFARRAAQFAQEMNESTKLSELAQRSGLFPPDHVSLFMTGEMAGDIPQALGQSSRLSEAMVAMDKKVSVTALISLATILVGLFMTVGLGIFYKSYFDNMFRQVDKVEEEL